MKTLCRELAVKIDQRPIGEQEDRRPEIKEAVLFPFDKDKIGKKQKNKQGSNSRGNTLQDVRK